MLDHLFLLTKISSTKKNNGNCETGQSYQLVRAEGDRFINQILEAKGMVSTRNTGTLAIVANVLQRNGFHKNLMNHFAYLERLVVEKAINVNSDEIRTSLDRIIQNIFVPCICVDIGFRKKIISRLCDVVQSCGRLGPCDTLLTDDLH